MLVSEADADIDCEVLADEDGDTVWVMDGDDDFEIVAEVESDIDDELLGDADAEKLDDSV